MLNRRSFLGVLLASLGATAIDPKALLWQPTPEAIEVVTPTALLSLPQITRAMLKEIIARSGHPAVPFDRYGEKIGHSVNDGRGNPLTLNHQYCVEVAAPDQVDRYGLDTERYLIPAAASFAQRIGRVKASGRLPLLGPHLPYESCVVCDAESGLSLRAIRGLVPDDTFFMTDTLRFDMLVAS